MLYIPRKYLIYFNQKTDDMIYPSKSSYRSCFSGKEVWLSTSALLATSTQTNVDQPCELWNEPNEGYYRLISRAECGVNSAHCWHCTACPRHKISEIIDDRRLDLATRELASFLLARPAVTAKATPSAP